MKPNTRVKMWPTCLAVGIATILGCTPTARAVRLTERATAAHRQGRCAEALSAAQSAGSLRTRLHGPGAPQALAAQRLIVSTLESCGQLEPAVAVATTAIAEGETAGPESAEQLAAARRQLAWLRRELDDGAVAASLYRRAIEDCDAMTAGTWAQTCRYSGHSGLYRLLVRHGRYEEAEPSARFFWTRLQMGTDQPSADGLVALGNFYREYGAYARALECYKQAGASPSRRISVDHTANSREPRAHVPADIRITVATRAHEFSSVAPAGLDHSIAVLRHMGRTVEAETLAIQEREAWAHAPGIEQLMPAQLRHRRTTAHSDSPSIHTLHAWAYYSHKAGDKPGSQRLYTRALALCKRQYPYDKTYDSPSAVEACLDIVAALVTMHQRDGGIATAQNHHEWFTRAVQALHPRHRSVLHNAAQLAQLHTIAGRHTKAIDAWQRYLQLAKSSRGTDHADYAFGIQRLAEVSTVHGTNPR